MQKIQGGVTAPKGFKAGAAHCGLKKDGYDVGILLSERPAQAAAMFTTNQIVAAPVVYSREAVQKGPISAVVVNSGNANACTGKQGMQDTKTMVAVTASSLSVSPDHVLVASTGIIGERLPMDRVVQGIRGAAGDMGPETQNGHAFAQSIMTTDTRTKEFAITTKAGGQAITIGGTAKGAGMIAPNMATMLCFLTTDSFVPYKVLGRCLKEAVTHSLNRISVDGHMSTNDMVVILSNGAAGDPVIDDSTMLLPVFQEALNLVTRNLATAVIKDAEGATKLVRLEVSGAPTDAYALQVARTIGNSPLVKTAINGEDPNWGRIISAAGATGIPLDEQRLSLYIGDVLVFDGGVYVTTLDKEKLSEEMKKKEVYIHLHLGLGKSKTEFWTCDLSHEYITINAKYHT
ncbi:MAG: bifunctional glutamate N-acetyltransferase/amino-acid acetyltransferase ArgJ [Candidatus Brocadiales bacterium]